MLRNLKKAAARTARPRFEPLEPRLVLDVGPLVISEFMADNETVWADGDGDFEDWLEIHNRGTEPAELGGWYLTDKLEVPTLWQFPQTTLGAGEYLVVFASSKHPNGPAGELHTNFKLSKEGEYLALVQPDGVTAEFAFAPEFPPQFDDVSYGLSPDFSTRGYFTSPTPGEPNVGEPIDDPTEPVIISEIMYHPASENDLEEYIELFNRGIDPVNLLNWSISQGVDFSFPDETLQPGEYLVVAADLPTFDATYTVPEGTTVVGGWTGRLSNRGEEIELVDSAGERVDRVRYSDEGDWAVREEGPDDLGHTGWIWADDHDAGGKSLELINPVMSNKHGQNWAASVPEGGTPGAPNSVADDDVAPIILDVSHFPVIPRSADPVVVTARFKDELPAVVTASVYYREDGAATFTSLAMEDDGLSEDGEAGDGAYGAVLPVAADGTVVEFYVEASDGTGNTRTWPAPTRTWPTEGEPSYEQLTNLLYQVDNTFDPDAPWDPESQPIYYLVMTEAERAELADIGLNDDDNDHESNAQMNGTFISRDGTGTGVRHNVGIRNRGARSRRGRPNNYRVNFAHDRAWKDVTEISVNSRYGHVQLIGSAIFRIAGLVAADASAVQVRVNGADLAETGSRMYGSYAAVEPLGSELVEKHFPDDPAGNLYQCREDEVTGEQPDLRYEGTDPDDYRATYFKQTKEEADDWSDLIQMLDVLNNSPQEGYVEAVSQVIDVDQWVRYLALDALLANAEGGLNTGKGDDYALYCGNVDSRFVLVPHDLDTVLGQGDHTYGYDESIFTFLGVDGLNRFLSDGEVVLRFYAAFLELIETVYNPEVLNPLLDQVMGGYVPQARINAMKQFVVDRTANVLTQIPREFTIQSDLPVVDGYPYSTSHVAELHGTANAAETRSVKVDGLLADWSAKDGTWSVEVTTGDFVSDTLVRSDAAVTYHVPTAGEDPVAWTDVGFDDGDWIDSTGIGTAGLLITEVGTGSTRLVEIENVSREAIDATGCSVLVNDASAGDINAVHGVAWNLPGLVDPGQVLYRTDDPGDNYWGSEIAWDPEGPGWVMIVDGAGHVMDFAAWGYTEAEIAALDVSFGPFASITIGDQWSGPGAEPGSAGQGHPGKGGFVAFNDHVVGAGTHPNATTYAANGTASGPLKDIITGLETSVTLTTSHTGVIFDNSSSPPAQGTDAFNVFDGFVDFSAGAGVSIELEAINGDEYTHAFSGLDTGDVITYDFTGTSIRGNAGYTDRWTLVTLEGADSAQAAHSTGGGVVVVSPTEVAFMAGDNSQSDQGYVAAWTDIDPGPDGEFSIVSTQYTGAIPGGGTAAGRIGYGLTAVRLEEVDPNQPLSWLQRRGDADSHTADDFIRTPAGSKGAENPMLTVPFGTVVPNVLGIGFSDDQPPFEAIIETDVGEPMQNVNASLWNRIEFQIDETPVYDTLTLKMKYDDGFVAYLNGTEVARRNADNPLAYNTAASDERDNPDAVVFEDIDVSGFLDRLGQGTNVLAIHGQNLAAADGDFLIQAELVATRGTPEVGVHLQPGINRVLVETFDGPYGTGSLLESGFIDLWYDPPVPSPKTEENYTLEMVVRDGYLSDVPILVRVEVYDDAGEVDRELWDAVATLTCDNPNVTISPTEVTLYNGMGSELVTVTGTEAFSLTARIEALDIEITRPLTGLEGAPVTTVSGELPGDTTWSGVVHVTGDLTVPDGNTLTLEPGTLVLIDGVVSGTDGTVISVAGDIQSLGSKDQPVTLTAYTKGENWGEIYHNSAEPSLYQYTNITQGGHSIGRGHTNTGPTIRTSGGSTIVFDRANLTDEAGKVMHAPGGGDLTFRNVHMARSVMGPEIWPDNLLLEETWITNMRHFDDADGIYIHNTSAGNALMTGGVSAGFDDDGVDTANAELTIEDWIIRDANDKGVSIQDGEVWFHWCLIVDNAKDQEDGIATSVAAEPSRDDPVTVHMDHVTLVSTPLSGPDVDVGVWGWDKYGLPGVPVIFYITNSIIVASDPIKTDYDPADVHVNYTNVFSEPWPGTGNIDADPLFVDPAGHDYHLQAGSPNVDAGDPTFPVDPDGTRTDRGDFFFDQRIIPGGHVTENVTLTPAGGPYRVVGDVIVDPGATLTIQPATTVFFETGSSLTINGRLLAEGTKYEQIRLTSVPGTDDWDGLRLTNTMEDNRISYAVIEGCHRTAGMIDLDNANLLVDHVTFDHADRRRIATHASSLIVRNSVFTDFVFPTTVPDNVAEHIWGVAPSDPAGHFIIENNVFGLTIGHNDAIDVDGYHRPAPAMQILGNVFLGSGDDAMDLEGDAHIEGNVFNHIRKDEHNTGSGNANAISAGDAHGVGHDYVMVRNVYYDVDHVAQVKENAFLTLVDNTVVGAEHAALYFLRPTGGISGRGAYLDGNIFVDTPVLFAEVQPDTELTVHRSVFDSEPTDTDVTTLGEGNLIEDPRLADPDGGDFRLLPGSPALGSGPNGLDMGALVPAGVSISGEPPVLTAQTDATLWVGLPDFPASHYGPYSHYKYRVNGGPWSEEISLGTPVELTGLADGEYTVEAIGLNSAGVWQDEAEATASKTWTVDTSLPRIRINEVLAINASTLEHYGTYPDLIELYNHGPSPVDLTGMSITDDQTDPARFVFPEDLVLAPGQYLVLYADDETDTPGLHLGFALEGSGEGVLLYDTVDQEPVLLDRVEFGHQLADLSIGRTGHDGDWGLTVPTFGEANAAHRTGNPQTLKINEWLAYGEVLFAEDFVELYNPDPLPVPLGGLFLTDHPIAQPDRHQIAPLSFVAGGGFVAFTADGNPEQGPTHLNFQCSREQELIGLYDAGLGEIDKILYYPQTLDVSQGRSPDGSTAYEFFLLPTPGVTNTSLDPATTQVIAVDDQWEYDDTGNGQGTAWREPDFDPSPDPAWPTGPGPLGWEDGILPVDIHTDVATGALTYYFRTHFFLDADPAEAVLEMTPMIDDGAVFYLGGVEALRLGMPEGEVVYDTPSARSVVDADFEGPFLLPTNALERGDNVIAVEVHQNTTGNPDIVMGLRLNATIPNPILERARALLDGLRITELMYHPADDNEAEFIELQNVGQTLLDLGGVRLAGAVEFTFPALKLPPGQYVVVARDLEAFQHEYGPGINVAGQYSGNLSDGGEEVVLQLPSPLEAAVLRFEYKDTWYPTTDGVGFALEIRDPAAEPAAWNEAGNWQAGTIEGGTPGSPDGLPVRNVLINEVLTHSDPPDTDLIELYNPTGEEIDVGGWYLSDSGNNLRKFRIPDNTRIAAGGYLTFDEGDFNPNPDTPGPNDFALNGAQGDDVWLLEADAEGHLVRVADHLRFGAARSGESFGRWPDGSGPLYPMTVPTDGENSGPRIGPVLISEVHYHPDHVNADDLEFVEIFNSGAEPVDLTNWRLRKGVDFDFPADTQLGPRAVLVVVPFELSDTDRLEAFRAAYELDESVVLVGGYSGRLSDGGETVRLQRPDDPPPDQLWLIPRLLEDEVIYANHAPWPTDSDGGGTSLNRLEADVWGNDSGSWASAVPTPGVVVIVAQVVGRHVFYNDSAFDGNTAAADSRDDEAIAPDKEALLPGETATLANYTSYSRGINGIMIDVDDLPYGAVLGVDDFQFRVGNSNDPSSWAVAPALPTITMRPGDGEGRSDRVTLVWSDNVIQKQWLQVSVLCTANTGLLQEDVFYFGNAVGESGNSTTDAKVNAYDMLGARDNQRTFLNPAAVDFAYDYNRDARVNAYDMLIARDNQTHFLNALKLITVPGNKAGENTAETENALAQHALLQQAVGRESPHRETPPGRLAWLYEVEQTGTHRRRCEGSEPETVLVDKLLTE